MNTSGITKHKNLTMSSQQTHVNSKIPTIKKTQLSLPKTRFVLNNSFYSSDMINLKRVEVSEVPECCLESYNSIFANCDIFDIENKTKDHEVK